MTTYLAVLHKGDDGSYGIMFPDFPGCVSVGSTFEDAVREGAEALSLHAEGMKADGDVLPLPRDIAQVKASESWVEWEGALLTMVPLIPAPDKVERVQVTLERRLLAQIDAVAKNRSAFLASAAESYLNKV